MAASMIGVNQHIIAFDNEGVYMVMLNPTIFSKFNLSSGQLCGIIKDTS